MKTADFQKQLAWAKTHMTRTAKALSQLPDLTGIRLACSMHLDLKMTVLVEGLLAKGAELFITTCNPTTVRDSVVEEMQRLGAHVQATKNMSENAYQNAIEQGVAWQPTHLCEMGADLSYELGRSGATHSVLAGLEATGSGINRLDHLELTYPIYNWDDLPVKEGLHNRHMVGLTTWHAFFNRTGLTLHEKRVLVVGYGSVGRGVASSAKAFGGTVVIAEKDPGRRIEASYDGWLVQDLDKALPNADVVITVTGCADVISAKHIPMLKDGAFLLNSVHRADEINLAALKEHPTEAVIPFVDAFEVDGKTVYLFAGGSMANLTAGEGDSLNAFDVTLAVLTAGIGFIVSLEAQQKPDVYILPQDVWEGVL